MWFFRVGMILNGESVTVLVTVTSLGAEVDKPRELADPRFIERIDIDGDPLISLVRGVLPRCSKSQVTCPVVLRAPVSVINVHAWIGFATLLAVFHDEFVQANIALLTKPCLGIFRHVMLGIPITEVPRVFFDVIDISAIKYSIFRFPNLHQSVFFK